MSKTSGVQISDSQAEVFYTYAHKFHKEFAFKLELELTGKLPALILKDQTLIPDILADFCLFRGITPTDITGHNISYVNVQHRKEFFAVLLLCYHPEKILSITRKRVWPGVEKAASDLLDCYRSSLANFVKQIISHYHFYKDFRETCTQAHAFIIQKYQGNKGRIKTRQYDSFSNQLTIFNAAQI